MAIALRLDSAESSNHHTFNGELLLHTLDTYRPHLTEAAYTKFGHMVTNYLADDAPTSEHESLLPQESRTQQIVNEVIERNQEGLAGPQDIQKFKMRELDRLVRGFRDAGVRDYTEHPILVEAFTAVGDKVDEVMPQLDKKHELFVSLMTDFSTNYSLIAEEIAERRAEHLETMTDKIRASVILPKMPRGRKAEKAEWQAQRDKVKLRLVADDLLPTDEQIIEDYFVGAAAAYRRIIYGYRELILDKGSESDSREEMDTYQRRYYDLLGGWRIAVSAESWAYDRVEKLINECLYGDTEVKKYLDDLTERYAYSGFSSSWGKRGKQRGTKSDPYFAPDTETEEPADKVFTASPPESRLYGKRGKVYDLIKDRVDEVNSPSGSTEFDDHTKDDLLRHFHHTLRRLPDTDIHDLDQKKLLNKVLRIVITELHPDTSEQKKLDEHEAAIRYELCQLAGRLIKKGAGGRY